ncbi:MAG: hypothetical protein JXK16_03795 [Thiotrichales bacterium]|nr:hypothetical protein [Thiotrichales bacterium]
MIKVMLMFIVLFGLSGQVVGADTDDQKQIGVVKQYYQNLLNNKPERSYQLLSSKDKSTYTEEQFVRVINLNTALYNPNRVVTIKDAIVEESGEDMAIVKIFAEVSTKGEQGLKGLSASQIVVHEKNEWKVYAAHTISSMLIKAKTMCESNINESMSLLQKEKACFIYYGRLDTE